MEKKIKNQNNKFLEKQVYGVQAFNHEPHPLHYAIFSF
jgi:hypothetical protein